MTKGTPSMGKFKTPTHARCRRCGKRSFHYRSRRCAHCGFPDTKWRKYRWLKSLKERAG
ncbi:MAG: 50S ribosomal protein L37e [Thaumarchaeota archaeon]|nr:50S ribosomal protein L37e [Candidatus Calditenuaceae archaeon]MDW8187559.1 50S ribosomal protein L37e [Nitrososphaerota archaeon]